MTLNNSTFDFLNRECKNYTHGSCMGEWRGLGIQVHCNCYCHKKKEELENSFHGDSNSNFQPHLQEEFDPDD